MTYQVLARKWRPRNFAEMVGQEHVVRALVNALDTDRVHHAFLFTGTRGVGKTTVARILAKSLNCETGVGSKPCGECSACREIDEGRFVDLIEVDAASRTRVEDTRELLENVQYAPTRGRFKVYLVDEVHMLSDHSFNALLKTLEEPPPHVKFLLATTDPQKLPVTILSRCLQFNLKRLPVRSIAEHLTHILEQEQVAFDPRAVDDIARAAEGSMRDGLSLLDQAVAHGGGRLSADEVGAMLGTIERAHVIALLRALGAGDGQQVLDVVEQLAEQAPDFAGVVAELLALLHRVALAQTLPEAVDDALGDREVVEELAAAIAPEDVQLFYQIGLLGRRDLPLAPDPRSGLEMILLRMLAFRPVQPQSYVPSGPARRSAAPENKVEDTSDTGGTDAAPQAAAEAGAGDQWDTVVEALGLKAAARELAVHCGLEERDENRVVLAVDPAYEQLATTNARQRLEQALQRYYDAPVRLDVRARQPSTETPASKRARQQEERHQQAVESIEGDAVVRDLQDVFDAEIKPELVRPAE